MTLLIQIEQPARLPLFVRQLHRDGAISVTFERGQALRFAAEDELLLVQVRIASADWAPPEAVSYVLAEVS